MFKKPVITGFYSIEGNAGASCENPKLAANVRLIPADPLKHPSGRPKSQKLRVAAYCRVSTDDSDQLNSYEAQVDYYTQKIENSDEWEMAGIFADEGITGTSTHKRTEFKRMLALCRRGKIDMILCKSVSRFSRNTLDYISIVRELKALGIPIIFEKDERLFQLIRDFLTVYLPEQRVCSANTIKSYKEALNLLLQFLQTEKSVSPFDVTFKMLSSSMILEFLSWLEISRHCSIATRNQRLACIRAFFNYAGKMDVSLIDYQNDLRKIPIKRGGNADKVTFIPEHALRVLLCEPDPTTSKGIRDLFYMILLYDSGARNRELLDLRLRDIDLKRGSIHVTGKGNKRRIIPIMEKTADHCRKYLALFHENEQDGNQYLFYILQKGQKQQMSDDNVARFIRIYGDSARTKCPEIPANIHPHLFRHTRAMHLYRSGMSLALLSEWLGHAHPDSTLIYANADTEMKRTAIQKATASSNPLNARYDLSQAWKNDEELLRELYGLK